ncbi:glutathione S-transferase theta-1 [Pteropus alecto]|uniref:glutathione S-transferase theta-1 n=1 Tax=Pteropus alecto TaxID=9402 RepID=UPI0007686491|nr:glutathione S-transferase theta-1 [Pteropus alecto]
MALELFLDLYLTLSYAIYIFAKNNGIMASVSTEAHGAGTGKHPKSEFLKANSLEKVPALRDGNFLLAESVAILLYLSYKYQIDTHWYPPQLQACTHIREYRVWQHTAIQQPSTNVYLCKSFLPHFLGQPVDATQLVQLLGRLMSALQHQDPEALVAKPFLVTEQVSLVEPTVLTERMQEAHRLVLQPWEPQEAQQEPQLAQELVPRLQERLH